MHISLIVAMTPDRVIGLNNQLPWHLPADLKHFKQVTWGKPLIMGRKTYQSIGRPLPGRQNIVVSTSKEHFDAGVDVAVDLEQALQKSNTADEVMIIGGATLYNAFLPKADRLYITWVECSVNGDTYFPAFNLDTWQCLERRAYKADTKNPFDYCFELYQRKTS